MDKNGIVWIGLLGLTLYLILSTDNNEINQKIFGVAPQAEQAETAPAQGLETPAQEAKPTAEAKSAISEVKAESKTTPPAEPVVKPIKELPLASLSTNADFTLNVKPGQGLKTADLKQFFKTSKKEQTVIIGDQHTPSFHLTGSAENWKVDGLSIIEKTNSLLKTKTSYENGKFDVIQTWELKEDYHFTVKYSIVNNSKENIDFSGVYINCGYVQPAQMGDPGFFAQQAIGNDQAIDTILKNDRKIQTHLLHNIKSDIEDKIEDAEEQGRVLKDPYATYSDEEDNYDWIAVKNQYFAFIADIKGSFKSVRTKTQEIISEEKLEDGSQSKYDLLFAEGKIEDFSITPGTSKDIELDIFAGPQRIDLLESMGKDKKGIMQLNMFMNMKVSWLGFLSELILKALFFFNGFVNSFGLSIILLTISVKLAFWRLTNKSNRSMKKMSALSPRIKEIREEHKDNPQVMNQKVMALYKEEGVNPAGGCLPMLLQMPIFIALFNALRSAIELRHVEFLWITDLAQPDTLAFIPGIPVRPLVITWAILMIVQQKMTPSTADETQKKVMMIMPVMMLFFCYSMPAGLTLYWCFQSLMTLIQYKLNNRTNDASPAKS